MKKEESPVSNQGKNGFGIASVVLGILGLCFATTVFFFYIGLGLSILSLIFALIQRKNSNNKWAFWGLILSIAGIVLNFIVLIKVVAFLNILKEVMEKCGNLQADPESFNQCITQLLGTR